MEHVLLTCLFLCLIIKGASLEKIGPAMVLPNRPSGQPSATAAGKAARTTTVYGFLDFTTTIDNTVVVFKPSSAAPSTATSIQSSRSPESEVKNTRPANDRILNTKLRPQASVSVNSGRQPPTSPRKVVIKTNRLSDQNKNSRIVPTPTIGRANPPLADDQGGGLSLRRGTPSSLAEKRRRFLALARRQKPEASSQRTSPLIRQVGDTSFINQDDQAQDQEMAETIEVSPSKVKRFQDLSNLSTFYAFPGAGNGTNGRDRARVLVRKLYRRPNERLSEGGKSRLLALRRSGAKNRLLLPGSHARDVEPNQDIVISPAAASLATISAPDIIASSVSSKFFDATSATIAEYLHESAEYAIDANPLNSILLPSLVSSKLDNEADISSSTSPDLQGSHSDSDLQLVSSLDADPFAATRPLSIIKGSGMGDPGLTVPLQLSIITSTFSRTETRLRTSLLPVYDGTSTTFYTLTHSFLVTKTVTTFQTVPPEEFMPYLIPGNDSYNSINDVFGDFSLPPPTLQRKSDDDEESDKNDAEIPKEDLSKELLEKSGTENVAVDAKDSKVESSSPAYPMGNPLLGNLPFLNLLGPAAALGLNPYFPYGLGLPQVVTTSRPVFSTDVIFTSKLLPIIDGLTTLYHTVREPASTVTHTSFETFTTQVQGQHPLGLGGNNLGQNLQQGGPQQVSTVTSPHTFVTTETETATQVFKLMYDGYKTSYRTVSSTNIVTRTISTYTTTTVPVYNQLLPFFG